jgi:hypothetical protein
MSANTARSRPHPVWGAKIPSAIQTTNEMHRSRRGNPANRPKRVIENAGTGGEAQENAGARKTRSPVDARDR